MWVSKTNHPGYWKTQEPHWYAEKSHTLIERKMLKNGVKRTKCALEGVV